MESARPFRKAALAVIVGASLLLCIAAPLLHQRLLPRGAAPTSLQGKPIPQRVPIGAEATATVRNSRPMAPQFTVAETPPHDEKEKFPLRNLSTPPPGLKLELPDYTRRWP